MTSRDKCIVKFIFIQIIERKSTHVVPAGMKYLSVIALFFLCCACNAQLVHGRILCLKFYQSDQFNTAKLDSSLNSAGFEIDYMSSMPQKAEFSRIKYTYSQIWVISDLKQHIDSSYYSDFEEYMNMGGRLYLLADNEPYDVDAELLAQHLIGNTGFVGNYVADDQGVPADQCDINEDSSLDIYEGFTVSSIGLTNHMKPQFMGSVGQIIVASYQTESQKILLDGGFTRMYTKWTDASAKYFTLAANWLNE